MSRKGFLVALLVILVPSISLGATIYNLTDTTTGAGAGTEYTLVVSDPVLEVFGATLTVDTIENIGWYIDWFAFKFDGGTAGVITSSIVGTAPGTWLVGNGTVDLENYNNFPNNTWTGAYENSILAPASLTDIDDGVPLDGEIYTWLFSFTLGAPFNPAPSFQVGYYDGLAGGSQNILFNRLSQQFQVAEPGTLLLLGSGLIGLGMLRRKFRR